MTDAFYAEIRDDVADDLIRQFGRSLTLREEGSGAVFDGASGFVTAPGTPTDYPVTGLFTKFRQDEVDGTSVKQDDLKVLLSAQNRTTEVALAVVPSTEMILLDDATEYAIVSVKPLRPGNIDVVYTLQVRL